MKNHAGWRDGVDSIGKKEAALTAATKAGSNSAWGDIVIYSRDPVERRLRAVAVVLLVVADQAVHARLQRQRTVAL